MSGTIPAISSFIQQKLHLLFSKSSQIDSETNHMILKMPYKELFKSGKTGCGVFQFSKPVAFFVT